eukprot:COSAG02_NODE_29183_length_574_cov_0.985263_1_plen_110_part_10
MRGADLKSSARAPLLRCCCWRTGMPFAAKKRRLRAKVVISEESLSDESETELEIDGAVQTSFVPAWAAVPAETIRRQQEPVQHKKTVEQPPAAEKKQKKHKVTKEQRAAA